MCGHGGRAFILSQPFLKSEVFSSRNARVQPPVWMVKNLMNFEIFVRIIKNFELFILEKTRIMVFKMRKLSK